MAVTISTNVATLLDPAMAEIFMDGELRAGSLTHAAIFEILPSATKTIEKAGYNPPGTYTPKVEGANYSFAPLVRGNTKTYTMSESQLSAEISSLTYRFLDRMAIAKFVGQFGIAKTRKLVGDAWGVISGGFTDVGPDGKSLFATDHTVATGAAQSNTGTSALGEAALQAAIVSFMIGKSPDGVLIGQMPKKLVVAPTKMFTALELTGSTLSGSDMQINALRGFGLEVIAVPELEAGDNDDWMLFGEDFKGEQYVSVGDGPKQFIDQNSGNWKVTDDLVTTQGYTAWRDSFGSNVA